ncbi:efflux pump 1 [Phytophthora cinnamomi]|uniref:efflux pump 1 n=1 Tax=Phytophthora cinnamomi TaxID=4785 RepID=UPI00355AA73D|nr:efflux pump 1 [Phytophthora cinnamomi]
MQLPSLEVLLLSDNLLHVLEDIMALATAPRLCELDVRDNPLRLSHNRLYLLETLLFHETNIDEDVLRELHRDENLKAFDSDSQFPKKLLYRPRLPRRHAFPMLQMLNADWISDVESRQAEIERGRPLEYFRSQTRGSKKGKLGASRKANNTARENGIKVNERRFDGSRMTVEQMLRNEARSTAIPLPQVLKHYQIDTESCEEVHEASDDLPEFTATTITLQNMERSDEVDDEHALMQQLFRPTTWQSQPLSADTDETKGEAEPDVKRPSGSSETEPWNYPISTFDDLQSEERQYVRYKSKHVGGTLERDDHFFESTTFLDCVAQCERSRRLTIRAVDLLTQPHSTTEISSELFPSRSTPYLPLSEAAATLTDNLTSNFTKQHARESFQRVTDFQRKQVTIGGHRIEAEVGDYLFGEHIALRQKTNHQLSGQAANEIRWRDNAHGIEASLEESLSKVKLRNAVDLANTLDGGKEQKRHIQALIDADAKVIEEERVMEEHKSHRQRLRRINARQVVKPPARRDVELAKKLASLHEESPWQERNWKAKMKLLERMQEDGEPPATSSRRAKRILPTRSKPQLKSTHFSTSSNSVKTSKDAADAPHVMAKFRTIETVEKAALDPLVEVNSHNLLVRCSEIRQNKDKHVKALAMHRDRFLEDEAQWTQMRQDPINVVRRHLRRKLYQDIQQVQIGNMEYFYSSVFQ